jgi:hypothetical protein
VGAVCHPYPRFKVTEELLWPGVCDSLVRAFRLFVAWTFCFFRAEGEETVSSSVLRSGDLDSPALGSVSGGVTVYSRPRHQIEASGTVSFLGSGSQKYCTIRLHFSMSTPAMLSNCLEG